MTIPVGAVMRAPGIGEVIESDHPNYGAGAIVYGLFGWSEWFAAEAKDIYWTIDPAIAPPPVWLGSLGINGITAWIGYRHFGRPKGGETLLVTTAAGSVGSVVGQLAREDDIRASVLREALKRREWSRATLVTNRSSTIMALLIWWRLCTRLALTGSIFSKTMSQAHRPMPPSHF